MTRSYFVETAAEAERAVDKLIASSYEATARPITGGYVLTVDNGPSVTIEETLLREAPTARRL